MLYPYSYSLLSPYSLYPYAPSYVSPYSAYSPYLYPYRLRYWY